MRRRFVGLAASVVGGLALVAPTPPTAQAAASTETEAYTHGAWPTLYPQCYLQGSRMRPSCGGACFSPPIDAKAVRVTIRDDSTEVAAGVVLFAVGYDGERISSPFCGSVSGVALPPETTGINVSTQPTRTRGACALGAQATSGTITVDFTG